MGFDDVLGQEQAKVLMSAALRNNRLGHAYLFTGPDGVGKTLFAQELAKALFCRGKGERPCDKCPDCRMNDRDGHPDLMTVEPMGSSRVIKIHQIRGDLKQTDSGGVLRFLTLRPVQAPKRVVIIREAERLNDEAANALLKTLEEPADFAVLVLTTARPRSLPTTIRSRCQELRFSPLAPDQVVKALSSHVEFEEGEIREAARFADGSAGRALEILDAGALEIHRKLLPPILALPKGDLFEITDDLLEWARVAGSKIWTQRDYSGEDTEEDTGGERKKPLEPQRECMREFLRLLQFTYRDVLLLRVGGGAEGPVDTRHAAELAASAARLTPSRLLRIEEAIWTARRQTDANAAMELILENLFAQIGNLQAAA
jgi:DNA polymerase-3 subunit delta'